MSGGLCRGRCGRDVHFANGLKLPWLLALLLAGLVAVPVGAFVAIPAIRRLSGVYLALATFGFGVLLSNVFYTTSAMFGQAVGGIPVPRPLARIGPWNLSTDNGFYYLLCSSRHYRIHHLLIQRGRLGRLLRGLADSPWHSRRSSGAERHPRHCLLHFRVLRCGRRCALLFPFRLRDGWAVLLPVVAATPRASSNHCRR